ncbi:MAG: MgtC/SapB family protein [Pseudomonadota bacterium]
MPDVDFEPYMKLMVALVLALPIAWDRERNSKIMGLRTFPLVSLGACAYILVGTAFIGSDEPGATARIVQGPMSGIGFVGGGAILKSNDHVSGTASAASIWVTGALGAAVGFGYWGYAIALSILNFSIVLIMSRLKAAVKE